MSGESIGTKYVLHFDGPEDYDPGAEPSTREFDSLADALIAGWRFHDQHDRRAKPYGITKRNLPVLNGEEMARACDRIDQLHREKGVRDLQEMAAQVLRELGFD